VLLANKCDIEGVEIDADELNRFCTEHGFITWFETSAKTDHKIDAAARYLVENVLSHEDIFAAKQNDRRDQAGRGVNVGAGGAHPYREGGCC